MLSSSLAYTSFTLLASWFDCLQVCLACCKQLDMHGAHDNPPPPPPPYIGLGKGKLGLTMSFSLITLNSVVFFLF